MDATNPSVKDGKWKMTSQFKTLCSCASNRRTAKTANETIETSYSYGHLSQTHTNYAQETLPQSPIDSRQECELGEGDGPGYMEPSYVYSKKWKRGPIGVHVESIFEKTDLDGFGRALELFETVMGLFQESATGKETEKFLDTASKAQVNSANILIEWYEGHFRTVAKAIELKAAFQAAVDKEMGLPIDEDDKDFLALGTIQMPVDPGCLDSEYAGGLFVLWMYEFYFSGDDINDNFVAELEEHRYKCIKQATVQKLAWSIFPELVNGVAMNRSKQIGKGIPLTTSGSSEACPWLIEHGGLVVIDTAGEKSHAPHYLWEIKAKRLVEVANMENVPQYCVISHSWRPRQAFDIEGTLVTCNIDSIPWKVPQLADFDVTNFPTLIQASQNLAAEMDYIWIEILCVPPENSGSEFEKIRQNEIANHAAIFKSASLAYIWLDQISDWSGLENAISFMLVEYILEKIYNVDKDHLGLCFSGLGLHARRGNEEPTGFAEVLDQTQGLWRTHPLNPIKSATPTSS